MGLTVQQTTTRRETFRLIAGGAMLAAALPASAQLAQPRGVSGSAGAPKYRERWIERDGHRLYAQEYAGKGPTFILLHGFPDNLHIYDELAPALAAAGRHVIAFDFLGYGASDKPAGYAYSFDQQLADLTAVSAALGSGKVIPVAHDAGGPAAINFARANQARCAALILLNTYYADTPTLRFPEFIELCTNPRTAALGRAMMTDPQQAPWLLHFQQGMFEAKAPAALKAKFDNVLQPVINANFATKPSSIPAFLSMTGDAVANLAANTRTVGDLRSFTPPVQLIWGTSDPYLNGGVAEALAAQFPNARIKSLPANHWPQIDFPDDVAAAMLAVVPA